MSGFIARGGAAKLWLTKFPEQDTLTTMSTLTELKPASGRRRHAAALILCASIGAYASVFSKRHDLYQG